MQCDAVGQADPFADFPPGLDILRRQVDAVDLAAIAAGGKPSGAAEAASAVEDAAVRRECELIEEMFGRRTATDMKFIDGRKIVYGDRVDGLSKRLHPGADGSDQIAVSIMGGNIRLGRHRRLQSNLKDKSPWRLFGRFGTVDCRPITFSTSGARSFGHTA